MFLASSSACTIVVGEGTPVNAELEQLVEGPVTGLVGLSDFRLFVSEQSAITELDLIEDSHELGTGPAIKDATDWSEDRVLLLSEENLLVWDGVLRPSPLEEMVPGAGMSAIELMSDRLWMAGDSGLRVWFDGVLSTINLDEQSARAPLLASRIGSRDVLWVAVDSGLVALVTSVSGYGILEWQSMEPPVGLAVDADGVVWAASGGNLHRRDTQGEWLVYSFPKPVTGVVGSSNSRRVWINTEEAVHSVVGEEFFTVSGVPEGSVDWHVDDVGRLVLRSGDSLQRASIERPIALRGLPQGNLLFATTELLIAPTQSEMVSEVSGTLAGTELVVEQRDNYWRTVMEPAQLEAGEFDLEISVDYGGEVTTTTWTMIISNPTWSEDIQPLYRTYCSACHSGETGTAILEAPEAWEKAFDNIVARIDRNNMPLGSEKLSDLQKGTIRAWGAKGFPR